MAQVQSLRSRPEWITTSSNPSSGQPSPRVNYIRSCILLDDLTPSAGEPCLDIAIGQLDPRPENASPCDALHSILVSSHENVSASTPPLKGAAGSETYVSSAKPTSIEEENLPSPAISDNQDRRHSLLQDIVVPIRRIFHQGPPEKAAGKQPIKAILDLPEAESAQLSRNSSIIEKYGRIRHVIGKGSGGTVRLVQKPQGKLFAVKEFRLKRDTETRREYLKKAYE
ncbi:serine/threonine protein kinase [Entomophthora muscae]|uniref:Serine/threonine protein kinase n=1 Tax=Entomophthora muscae TaxID=34485 RepID=A0ACC2TE19_9FUNG|nr:serine/threonine protein kinase [Entomophthora muscae]